MAAWTSFPARGHWPMTHDDISIEILSPDTEGAVRDLIRRNLSGFDQDGTVLTATYRRLPQLLKVYGAPGYRYLVLRDAKADNRPIGGAGIGSLHGLSPQEGLGEIRDLVLDAAYRGRGLGGRLLSRSIGEAKALGYRRLYLETTPQMEKAQKLFIRFGFRPVTQAQTDLRSEGTPGLPGYFLLETL